MFIILIAVAIIVFNIYVMLDVYDICKKNKKEAHVVPDHLVPVDIHLHVADQMLHNVNEVFEFLENKSPVTTGYFSKEELKKYQSLNLNIITDDNCSVMLIQKEKALNDWHEYNEIKIIATILVVYKTIDLEK